MIVKENVLAFNQTAPHDVDALKRIVIIIMESTSIRSSGIAYRHERRLLLALCTLYVVISISLNIYFEFNGKNKKQSECFQQKILVKKLIALHN